MRARRTDGSVERVRDAETTRKRARETVVEAVERRDRIRGGRRETSPGRWRRMK